ncbi:MAG: hypothetical protein J7539_05420 [Niabella sp.]|nr:hypothetical protein [Niabella sp.]
MLKKLLSYVFVWALLLEISSGCNSDNGKTQNNPASGSAATNGTPVVKQAPVVVIEQMKFTPDTLAIQPGDTVTFINKDIVPHDITEVNGGQHSGKLDPGTSWRFVPQKNLDYFCSIHMVMKGSIRVHR